jgi:precorrin-2 dehydrogenase/sirohydrochlorin ferrochelatase
MKYYPINLSIAGRRCVVVGGGEVAARKIATLLDCNGLVEVISPELVPALQRLRQQGELLWRARPFCPGDLAGAFLVVAATDDEQVQAEVFAEASANGQLVNVADVPARCNFILPALVSRGDLVLAVSTAGKSPALARRISRELAEAYGEEYGIVVEIMGLLRPLVLARGGGHRFNRELFNTLLHAELPHWVKNADWTCLEAHLVQVLGDDLTSEYLNKIKKMLNCWLDLGDASFLRQS